MAPLAGEALSRRHSCIGLSVLGVWLAWWLAEPGGPAGNAALAFSPVYSAKVLKAMQKVRAPRKGRIPRKRTLDGKPGRTMTASKAGRKAFLMKRIGDPKIKASQQHFRVSQLVESRKAGLGETEIRSPSCSRLQKNYWE